jgi:hypothetical protein
MVQPAFVFSENVLNPPNPRFYITAKSIP